MVDQLKDLDSVPFDEHFDGTVIARPEGVLKLHTEVSHWTDKHGVKITDCAPVDEEGRRYAAQVVAAVILIDEEGKVGIWQKDNEEANAWAEKLLSHVLYARGEREE